MERQEITDMEELHARLYETVSRTVEELRKGTLSLTLEECKGCAHLSRCELPYVDALRFAFTSCGAPCSVSCQDIQGRRVVQMSYEGEVFMQIDPLTKQALQKCTDDTCNQVLYHQVFGVNEEEGT